MACFLLFALNIRRFPLKCSRHMSDITHTQMIFH